MPEFTTGLANNLGIQIQITPQPANVTISGGQITGLDGSALARAFGLLAVGS